MANDSQLFEYERFSGMNNVDKSYRLPLTRDDRWRRMYDLAEIENLDIDNAMVLSSRLGSVVKLTGTDIHSLWSDGNVEALFVDATVLKRLTPQYTAITIGEVGVGRMSYAPWNDRVYMTNGTYIGYYKDDALAAVSDPATRYKDPLPAGRFIAYYRSRLYVAKGNVLYISDSLGDHYDTRSGYRTFENDITMLVAVENGLYVADGITWFTPGAGPEEFKKDNVFDNDAIPYTAITLDGKYVGDGLPGICAMWASADGICVGDGSGKVKNLTRHRYSMDAAGIGGAVLRNVGEKVHYVTSMM